MRAWVALLVFLTTSLFIVILWKTRPETYVAYSYLSRISQKIISEDHLDSELPFGNCPLVNYDPWNEEMLPYFNPLYGFGDSCDDSFVISQLKDGKIYVTDSTTTCWNSCFSWVSSWETKFGEWVDVGVVMQCDVVAVRCSRTGKIEEYDYEKLHAQIVEIKQKKERKMNSSEQSPNKNKKMDGERRTPNVIIMIIDSMGMGEAERVFIKSLSYMRQKLQAITFPHFNKVGLNSYPNTMPLLIGIGNAGNDIVPLISKSVASMQSSPGKVAEAVDRQVLGLPDIPSSSFENVEETNIIFKWFNESGYRTYYSENYDVDVFTWPDMKGFQKQPTDHILNHYFYRSKHSKEGSPEWKSFQQKNCYIPYQVQLDHLSQFIKAYKGEPHFSFLWDTDLGHDSTERPVLGDTLLIDWLIKNKKEVDESVLIFAGDHGYRFAPQARLAGGNENNTPLMVISLPQYLRKNEKLVEVMRENAQKMQTMWDLRATIHDLLERSDSQSGWSDLTAAAPFETGFGSSLFRRQQGVRNCRTLPIPLAYCSCDYPKTAINSSSTLAFTIGKEMVSDLNARLNDSGLLDKCHLWKFDKVSSIEVMGGNVYTIVVETKQYPAKFQTLVSNLGSASSPIYHFSPSDRLDSYGKRGDCAGANSRICECKNYSGK